MFLASIIIFLLGLIFGSFLNALEWRLQTKKTLFARSVCRHCGRKLRWYHNIPLFSFIFLSGKCAFCSGKISWQYPIVELTVGIIWLGIWLTRGLDFDLNVWFNIIRDLVVSWVFIFIFVYDLKYQEVVDSITLGGAIVVTFFSIVSGTQTWSEILFGILLASGFFLLQFILSRGRWIGGGDIRIGILIGATLGWSMTLVALMVAYILGASVNLGFLLTKKKKLTDRVPFGTYLSVATLAVLWWGEEIVRWYIGLLS